MSGKTLSNKLANIDYMAPFEGRNDYRTSTYFGHRYIPSHVNVTDVPLMPKTDVCKVFTKKEMKYDFTSEQKSAYTNKFKENFNARIPRLMVNTVHYIQPYDEQFFKSAPKPINAYDTQYRKDYTPKDVPLDNDIMLEWKCPPTVKKSDIIVNPALPGYIKHLDMMATTNMLTYVQHIPESVEKMSAKENITMWNWLEFTKLKGGIKKYIPEEFSERNDSLCQEFPSQLCPKRRELQNQTKHVPHKGLTTETRENYIRPEPKIDSYIENDEDPVQFVSPVDLEKPSTESQMYGSKQRIQKYIDVRKKCTKTLDCPPFLLNIPCI